MSKASVRIEAGYFGDIYVAESLFAFDVVIVCKNDGHGLEPITLRLPHQLRVSDFADVPGLTFVPANARDYVEARPVGEAARRA